MPHMCPTKGCRVTVPDHLLMCKRHWYELTRAERQQVHESHRSFGPGLRHIQNIQHIIDRQAIRMNRGEV